MIPSIATDLFFSPSSFGYEGFSLSGMIENSLNKCDLDIKTSLYKSIFLTGGNVKIKNFGKNVLRDV